jgi:hypothetical protein
VHDAGSSGSSHKDVRQQRVQLLGEARQLRKIATRDPRLKDIVPAFDQPFVLQAAAHCRHSWLGEFFSARK